MLELEGSTYRGKDARHLLAAQASLLKVPMRTHAEMARVLDSMPYGGKRLCLFREPRHVRLGKSMYKTAMNNRGLGRRARPLRGAEASLGAAPTRPRAEITVADIEAAQNSWQQERQRLRDAQHERDIVAGRAARLQQAERTIRWQFDAGQIVQMPWEVPPGENVLFNNGGRMTFNVPEERTVVENPFPEDEE